MSSGVQLPVLPRCWAGFGKMFFSCSTLHLQAQALHMEGREMKIYGQSCSHPQLVIQIQFWRFAVSTAVWRRVMVQLQVTFSLYRNKGKKMSLRTSTSSHWSSWVSFHMCCMNSVCCKTQKTRENSKSKSTAKWYKMYYELACSSSLLRWLASKVHHLTIENLVKSKSRLISLI